MSTETPDWLASHAPQLKVAPEVLSEDKKGSLTKAIEKAASNIRLGEKVHSLLKEIQDRLSLPESYIISPHCARDLIDVINNSPSEFKEYGAGLIHAALHEHLRWILRWKPASSMNEFLQHRIVVVAQEDHFEVPIARPGNPSGENTSDAKRLKTDSLGMEELKPLLVRALESPLIHIPFDGHGHLPGLTRRTQWYDQPE